MVAAAAADSALFLPLVGRMAMIRLLDKVSWPLDQSLPYRPKARFVAVWVAALLMVLVHSFWLDDDDDGLDVCVAVDLTGL